MVSIPTEIPIILAFVIAGLVWSFSGFVKDYVQHVKFAQSNPRGTADPNWNGFDTNLAKNDLLLGLGLGIAAFFLNSYNGAVTVDVSTLHNWVAVVVGAFGVVALVDNYIVPTLSALPKTLARRLS